MRYGFVKNNLPPNGYASCAEFFQVFVDFVSRFTQLKTGMSQAFLASSRPSTPNRPKLSTAPWKVKDN
jgi:hypothetical protein